MLHSLAQEGYGKVLDHVDYCGVRHNLSRRVRRPFNATAWKEAHRRLKRIQISGLPIPRKKLLVRSMVLSKTCWAGGWQAPPKTQVTKLRMGIERAIVGKIQPGRSRALVWAAQIGHDACPVFAAAAHTVRLHRWRLRRRARGLKHPLLQSDPGLDRLTSTLLWPGTKGPCEATTQMPGMASKEPQRPLHCTAASLPNGPARGGGGLIDTDG